MNIYKMTFNSIHKIKFDCIYKYICSMLHLFDVLWLNKIIPKNNDRYKAIYGSLENKINTFYWPVKNSINKITMQLRSDADGKLQKVSGRCLILCSDHYVFSFIIPLIKITVQLRNDADGKLQKVSGRCLILCSDHYVFSLRTSKKVRQT